MRYPSTGSIGELLRIENISIGAVAYFDTRLSKESPQLPVIARNGRVPCYFVFQSLFHFERYPRRHGRDLKPVFCRIGYAENVYRSIGVERKAVRVSNVWSLYNGVVVLSRDISSLLFCLKRATIPRYSTFFYPIARRSTVSEGRYTLVLADSNQRNQRTFRIYPRVRLVVRQRVYRIDACVYHPLVVYLLVNRDR